jgi:hypothetical protein
MYTESKSMSTIDRQCAKCGRRTPHTVKDVVIPVAQEVPNGGRVDLTGGFYKGKDATPAVEGRVQNTLPFAKTYTCTICGSSLTAFGDDIGGQGGDDFSLLARGADWKNPGL